jgi:hypothetical protein
MRGKKGPKKKRNKELETKKPKMKIRSLKKCLLLLFLILFYFSCFLSPPPKW